MKLEEIVLSSGPADTPVEQPPADLVSTTSFTQKCRLRFCSCVFELFNRRYLSISKAQTFGEDREFELDIAILDPTPKRSLKICWRYVGLFLALLSGSVYLVLNRQIPNADVSAMMLSAMALLSLVIAIFESQDRLVFYTRYGRAPLVILFRAIPDRATVSDFADRLAEFIRQASRSQRSRNEILNSELKELRRLMEEDIISTQRYDAAKQRILDKHG